jgi:hypothetical protein
VVPAHFESYFQPEEVKFNIVVFKYILHIRSIQPCGEDVPETQSIGLLALPAALSAWSRIFFLFIFSPPLY